MSSAVCLKLGKPPKPRGLQNWATPGRARQSADNGEADRRELCGPSCSNSRANVLIKIARKSRLTRLAAATMFNFKNSVVGSNFKPQNKTYTKGLRGILRMQKGLGKTGDGRSRCFSAPYLTEPHVILAIVGHLRRDFDACYCSRSCRARVPFSAHVLCRVSRPRNGKTAHCWPGAHRTR